MRVQRVVAEGGYEGERGGARSPAGERQKAHAEQASRGRELAQAVGGQHGASASGANLVRPASARDTPRASVASFPVHSRALVSVARGEQRGEHELPTSVSFELLSRAKSVKG